MMRTVGFCLAVSEAKGRRGRNDDASFYHGAFLFGADAIDTQTYAIGFWTSATTGKLVCRNNNACLPAGNRTKPQTSDGQPANYVNTRDKTAVRVSMAKDLYCSLSATRRPSRQVGHKHGRRRLR